MWCECVYQIIINIIIIEYIIISWYWICIVKNSYNNIHTHTHTNNRLLECQWMDGSIRQDIVKTC